MDTAVARVANGGIDIVGDKDVALFQRRASLFFDSVPFMHFHAAYDTGISGQLFVVLEAPHVAFGRLKPDLVAAVDDVRHARGQVADTVHFRASHALYDGGHATEILVAESLGMAEIAVRSGAVGRTGGTQPGKPGGSARGEHRPGFEGVSS